MQTEENAVEVSNFFKIILKIVSVLFYFVFWKLKPFYKDTRKQGLI